MNEDRNISDIRHNVESMLYSYYIKYNKLDEFMKITLNEYNKFNCTKPFDFYIDIYDMLKVLYGVDIYADKKFTIVSSIINLAAHIRWYTTKTFNNKSRIFLIYADGSNDKYSDFESYKMRLNFDRINKFITSQLELVKILSAYIYDVYFINRSLSFPVIVYDLLYKTNNIKKDSVSFIVTKNKDAYQLASYNNSNHVYILRPKKSKGEDVSHMVTESNKIQSYFADNVKSKKTIEYMKAVKGEYLPLLMAMSGYRKSLGIVPSVSIRMLYNFLYNTTAEDYKAIAQYKKCKYPIPEITRYSSYDHLQELLEVNDLFYRHLDYINNYPIEQLDMTYAINLSDPKAVQEINNKYFIDNPLNIEVL